MTTLDPQTTMDILIGFLDGQSSRALTAKHKISTKIVFIHLQCYFQRLTQATCGHSGETSHWHPSPGTYPPWMMFVQLNQEIQRKNEELNRYSDALAKAESQITDGRLAQHHEHVEHQYEIANLATRIQTLEEETAKQDARIRTLDEALRLRHPGLNDRPLLTAVNGHPGGTGDEADCVTSETDCVTQVTQARRALDLFYEGQNLGTVSATSGLAPEEVFGVLQRTFRRPASGLLDRLGIPPDWKLDRDALIPLIRCNSFLFSLGVFDALFSCKSVTDLVCVLGLAFQDFSLSANDQWQFMAVFALEIGCKGVVYEENTIAKLADRTNVVAGLEDEVARLNSLRGRLTRTCRTIHRQNDEEIAAMRQELRVLRSRVAELDEQLSISGAQMDQTVSSPSEVRANVFREMITLARSTGSPRYSFHLYYMGVVILYRSPSTYDFLRQFLPLPSPVSIYHHFQGPMTASLARLREPDLVTQFLSKEIELHEELSQGVVVAVDAISCSNCFVGMKKVYRRDTAYLFVLYLQPLSPQLKCTPLFVIESDSGIGNDAIQAKIETILRLVRSIIARVFIASDGDTSYNHRHTEFLKYWAKWRMSLRVRMSLYCFNSFTS